MTYASSGVLLAYVTHMKWAGPTAIAGEVFRQGT
jgi:hypothetical protein